MCFVGDLKVPKETASLSNDGELESPGPPSRMVCAIPRNEASSGGLYENLKGCELQNRRYGNEAGGLAPTRAPSCASPHQGRRARREGAIAKLYATEAAFEIAHEALQVHGGIGYTKDLPVERYFREARS
jgi:hypothetical protein